MEVSKLVDSNDEYMLTSNNVMQHKKAHYQTLSYIFNNLFFFLLTGFERIAFLNQMAFGLFFKYDRLWFPMDEKQKRTP